MGSLWEMLGYDRVAVDIVGTLEVGTDVCVLEGPPGVGKSWLAKDIGEAWQAQGGSVVLAEGDSLKGDSPFHPFAFAMGGLPRGWRSVGPAVAGVARAGEILVGTAGLITATVEAAVSARRARRESRTIFLGDVEQSILCELERLAKKRPMLFIADNLHWWDRSSLGFLAGLRTEKMWDAFPFLSNVSILAVQTPPPYQSVADPEALETFLAPSTTTHFPLQRVPADGFQDILAALGASPPPSGEIAGIIHSFSGGHLALAGRCADRITKGESHVFLAASDAEEFVRRLLTERIQSLGDEGRQAVTTLRVAAILGLTFNRHEVTCASDHDQEETRRILRYCRREGLIEVADGLDRFVHDLYRQHFLDLSPDSRPELHEKLSECLRQLRPGEYQLRCLNAIDADQPEEAGVLAVQAALLATREGRDWTELPRSVLRSAEVVGGTRVIEAFEEAFGHLNLYRFGECSASLDGLPRSLPTPLVAEADYLRAMCLMSTRSETDRANARSILTAWTGYEEEEPELGVRLMLLLLYGYFHLSDKEPGWTLERRLTRSLSARAQQDPAALDALYTLGRCSGGLYPSDVALVRNREAVQHFGPRDGRGLVRRPVEYYRCMVNYGAALIGNGHHQESLEVHAEIDELIDSYRTGVFPRVDYPRMNGLLTQYRLQLVDADQAATRQREIAASHPVKGDPFYVQNALAVYLALAGRHDTALEIFDRLDAELRQSRTEPEPSMVYLIQANRCAVRHVAGRGAAEEEWAALAAVAQKSNYTDRDAVMLRHELLATALRSDRAMTAAEFDTYILEHHPDRLGPHWKSSGLGFMMPAIEFWREN